MPASPSDTAELAASSIDPAARRRAVWASVLGNGLEWFDFMVYGYFSTVLAGVFFPAQDPFASRAAAFGVFALSYVVRPFGGILIGVYADRYGRRNALSLLILGMAVGTLVIGLTPGHAAIGIAAPLLVMLGRVIQGLSVGGEFASGTALLVEYAPPEAKIFYGSFQMSSQALSQFLASTSGFLVLGLMPHEAGLDWGWRLPFLLGSLVGPVGFYLRRRIADSPEFLAARKRREERKDPAPVGWRVPLAPMSAGMGIIVMGTAGTYLWSVYLPTFVRQLGLPLSVLFRNAMVCSACSFALMPLVGRLADKVGPFKVLIPGILVYGLMAYPLFDYVVAEPSGGRLFLVQFVAMLGFLFVLAPGPGTVALLFPTALRGTGMAIAYNIPVMIFGGLAPSVVDWIHHETGDAMAPAYYLLAAMAVSLALVLVPLAAARERLRLG